LVRTFIQTFYEIILFTSLFIIILRRGICVCELCSKDKVRIPKLDERNLYKVCTHCGKLLKEARSYGFQSDITA
jgi:hypothetical protein